MKAGIKDNIKSRLLRRVKPIFLMALIIITPAATRIKADDQVPIDTVKSAPGLSIESAVDRSEIYIGDLITYRLTIIYDSTYTLTSPPIGANLGAFDVKDYQSDQEEKLEDGRVKIESRFKLTTFTTGEYVIPPIPVEFMLPDSTRRVLISEPIPINVKSLLAESGDTTDIKDIKGPVSFESGLAWYYYFVGVLLLVIIVALIIWWRIRRRREGPVEPVDTRRPWEIAFADLAMLREKNLPQNEEYKLFYVELSEIVRAFLQRIYGIPVLDMTTYEFLQALIDHDVEESLYERYKKFLDFADLVKFAKFMPEIKKAESDYDEAVDIVEHLRQIVVAREEEEKLKEPIPAAGGSDV